MVRFISVALNAMCSFSVPIYLLEASILFNIVKGLLILIFFQKTSSMFCQFCFDSLFIYYFIIPILLLTLNLFLFWLIVMTN